MRLDYYWNGRRDVVELGEERARSRFTHFCTECEIAYRLRDDDNESARVVEVRNTIT